MRPEIFWGPDMTLALGVPLATMASMNCPVGSGACAPFSPRTTNTAHPLPLPSGFKLQELPGQVLRFGTATGVNWANIRASTRATSSV